MCLRFRVHLWGFSGENSTTHLKVFQISSLLYLMVNSMSSVGGWCWWMLLWVQILTCFNLQPCIHMYLLARRVQLSLHLWNGGFSRMSLHTILLRTWRHRKSFVFRDITLYSLLKVASHFGETLLTLQGWRVSQARDQLLTFNGLHDVISQKIEVFITTAVRTSISTLKQTL
jgi:hypothetical protein